jgi:hypothetical protein
VVRSRDYLQSPFLEVEGRQESSEKSLIWVIRSAQIGGMLHSLRNAGWCCVKAQDRSLPSF